MGQKTHPKGFRLKQTTTWDAIWYADEKQYGPRLVEDLKIRRLLEQELRSAQVSRVEIRRYVGRLIVNVYCVRVGIAVGRGGSRREQLRRRIERLAPSVGEVHLDFYEEPHPDLSAPVVVNNIIAQLEKRINFRRALKQQLKRCLQAGAQGVKLMVAGRLNGAEMSRTEWYRRGRIPLHTIRAKIDYACDVARTVYGSIGVKAWIYTGEVVPERTMGEPGVGES
ncbi:MAG: 30S ribosomal protein S3 [Planctomycetales bacterium 4484_113]|nr:MAG: 30S ribosomal protein S3 [Planctomycetales bacterium 4484_113]